MERNNVQMNEMPLIIKIFSLLSLCGFVGFLVWGLLESIKFSVIGFVYLIQSVYFFIIFISIITQKKCSIFLLFIFFIANIVYSIWININQIMTKYGYISLGIMTIFLIILLYLLTREDVKIYFNHAQKNK